MAKAWNSTLSAARRPMKRTGFKAKPRQKKYSKFPFEGKPSSLKKTQLRKVAKTPVSKLKKKLWQLCREIAFNLYGSDCYTCSAVSLVGSNRHLGHFIASSVCSAELRYSLDNLRPQCYRCNIHLSGNWLAYESHLKADGYDVEALKQRNRDTTGRQYDRLWYESKIAEYETQVAAF